MSTILDQILATKAEEVAARKQQRSTDQLREQISTLPACRGFEAAINESITAGKPAVIAEVKKASPSKGVIRSDFDPVAIATQYAAHGATCLSVLTDEEYFQGHDDYLRAVSEAVSLPVLRKDFVIDEYQLLEARAMGADCVLLIVSALNIMQLTNLNQAARGLGLDVLIEVHDDKELAAALSLNPKLVGINNRNLKTFDTTLNTTLDLLVDIPKGVTVVTESGIRTPEDIATMRQAGVNSFLVGETFMRATNPGIALAELFF